MSKTSSLYESGFTPPSVPKDWERCSMTLDSTRRYLGSHAHLLEGEMVEAVGWFDTVGRCRVLIVDSPPKRLTLRSDTKNNWKLGVKLMDVAP